MIIGNILTCPKCGWNLRYYDNVRRIVRTKGGVSGYVQIRRMRCSGCRGVHREIPGFIFPYKQYEAEVIRGVLEGYITPETYGYEDYPSQTTMMRWKAHKIHLLL